MSETVTAATATAAATTQGAEAAGHIVVPLPRHLPAQIELLDWCRNMTPGTAAILVLFSVVYLMFGWYLYRALVTLNAGLIGAYIGAYIGSRTNDTIAGGFIGAFTAAAVSWPLMKWAVAVMGGLLGMLIGASIWRACGLQGEFAWAGGLSGLLFLGMLSFILFRGSVIMYTSLQGSLMLIFGVLGLVYKYQSLGPTLTQNMTLKPFILPSAIFVPAMFGLIYQHMNYPHPHVEAGKKK